MIRCVVSLNEVIAASHGSNSGLQKVSGCHFATRGAPALMKRLQTLAPVPTNEISHKDSLVRGGGES